MEREITFEDILLAKEQGPDALNEASLGRVYQHVKKSGKTSFGIITSWRAGKTKAENLAIFEKLQSEVRSAGLGFFKLKGHWKECQDPEVEYADCPPDQLVDAVEPAIFVPGISKEQILKLAKKYDQDAVIWAGPETNGSVVLIFKSGKLQQIGKFHPNRIAQAFSQVRGRSFTFEYIAQDWGESLVEKYHQPSAP